MTVASSSPDAIVIGAGPNGLAAANVLADAGWRVMVLEAAATPGGAVRSAELTLTGFRHDVFSAFYPLAAASPVMRSFDLGDHGLRWRRAPVVVAHPRVDAPAALLSMGTGETARSLDLDSPGDGDRWLELMAPWHRAGRSVTDALLSPFPPVKGAVSAAAHLGPKTLRQFTRDALVPVRQLGAEHFEGDAARLLLSGLALHADIGPDEVLSALFGSMMAWLGEAHGFPVPEGGAQELTDALVRRLTTLGGVVHCSRRVDRVIIRDGRAVGVEVDGELLEARRAVLADVSAPALYTQLIESDHLPAKTLAAISRYEPGPATVKVDWALSSPIPWSDPTVAGAGTVHLIDSVDDLASYNADLRAGLLPRHRFLLLGQMTTTDPTRSPAGTETAWAYTHVPQELKADAAGELETRWNEATRTAYVERIEQDIERRAPGFRDRIIGRHVFAPPDFAAWNENLIGGDTTGGTNQLHQQLIFRPIPGWARAETPVKDLYLASASAHPGGGVHGAAGANAARAAIAHDRFHRFVARVGTFRR